MDKIWLVLAKLCPANGAGRQQRSRRLQPRTDKDLATASKNYTVRVVISVLQQLARLVGSPACRQPSLPCLDLLKEACPIKLHCLLKLLAASAFAVTLCEKDFFNCRFRQDWGQ